MLLPKLKINTLNIIWIKWGLNPTSKKRENLTFGLVEVSVQITWQAHFLCISLLQQPMSHLLLRPPPPPSIPEYAFCVCVCEREEERCVWERERERGREKEEGELKTIFSWAKIHRRAQMGFPFACPQDHPSSLSYFSLSHTHTYTHTHTLFFIHTHYSRENVAWAFIQPNRETIIFFYPRLKKGPSFFSHVYSKLTTKMVLHRDRPFAIL